MTPCFLNPDTASPLDAIDPELLHNETEETYLPEDEQNTERRAGKRGAGEEIGEVREGQGKQGKRGRASNTRGKQPLSPGKEVIKSR